MLKTGLFTIAILAVSQTAAAQVALGGGGLIAGGQIQQIPPSPEFQKSIPDIRVERRAAPTPPGPPGPKALVSSLHVTGERLFSEGQLIAVTGFRPGSQLSLSDLREMAERITHFYNARGYFVAQAYVPAQDIEAGAVTITVIEGRYDKVSLRNQTNLSDRVAYGVLNGPRPGDPVASGPLERRLLLLSDVPGIDVKATLVPGGPVGTSDLIVDVTPGARVTGSIEADNAGNRYTGEDRIGATVNINDPLGLGDQLTLRALTSGDGMAYLRGSYQVTVGQGTVGVAYTHFRYHLGHEFASLDASGTEDIASVYGSYPLVRSRNDNLYALVDVDERWFNDRIGATATDTVKRDRVLTFGLNGNHRDGFGGGGWDTFYIYGSLGDLDIQTPAARVIDAATARTNGQYGKLVFFIDRTQTISGPFSIYGAFRGQLASKNLDISEKMELGGAYEVRAYPEGEGYGDEGYVATAELRYLLPKYPDVPGRFQLFTFVDTGTVRLSKNPWAPGPNSATRTGAGVGATWAQNNNFLVRVAYGFEVGTGPATSQPDTGGRFWIELVKFF